MSHLFEFRDWLATGCAVLIGWLGRRIFNKVDDTEKRVAALEKHTAVVQESIRHLEEVKDIAQNMRGEFREYQESRDADRSKFEKLIFDTWKAESKQIRSHGEQLEDHNEKLKELERTALKLFNKLDEKQA